jgi:hypothetical protein
MMKKMLVMVAQAVQVVAEAEDLLQVQTQHKV